MDLLTQSFEVSDEYDGERIDKFLAAIFTDKSRTFFQKLIKDGSVKVDGLAVKPSYSVSAMEMVEVTIPEAETIDIVPQDLPVEVLYEDDDVLVVNKPKDMVVHPSAGHYEGTLVNFVMYHCKDNLSGINGVIRPGIVHRIDKDTTGSLIICKNDMSHENIAAQIKEHSCDRVYLGIVCGRLKEESGIITSTIGRDPKDRKKMAMNVSGGKDAVTHYKVLDSNDKYSFVCFKLETGRTHQIRVHMAGIGNPLLGDITYGGKRAEDKRKLLGQCLHAYNIAFNQPKTGLRVSVQAPLPEYFNKLLKEMGFEFKGDIL